MAVRTGLAASMTSCEDESRGMAEQQLSCCGWPGRHEEQLRKCCPTRVLVGQQRKKVVLECSWIDGWMGVGEAQYWRYKDRTEDGM